MSVTIGASRLAKLIEQKLQDVLYPQASVAGPQDLASFGDDDDEGNDITSILQQLQACPSTDQPSVETTGHPARRHSKRTTGGSKTYDGATGSTDKQSLQNNALIVAREAQKKGVDPVTAVATMLVESGGNNRSVGDKGTSYGLFQLHRGGELGQLSPQQAFDPGTNASTALSQFARVQKSRGLTGGALAAAAQRPANPQRYAHSVDAKMPEARRLLEQAGFFNGRNG